MLKIALQLPGQTSPIPLPSNFTSSPYTQLLASPGSGGGLYFLVSQLLTIFLYVGSTLLLIWLSWGAFEYMVAGGNKDKLALARKRIIHALIGFIIILLAFSIWKYVQLIVPQQQINIQNVDKSAETCSSDSSYTFAHCSSCTTGVFTCTDSNNKTFVKIKDVSVGACQDSPACPTQ